MLIETFVDSINEFAVKNNKLGAVKLIRDTNIKPSLKESLEKIDEFWYKDLKNIGKSVYDSLTVSEKNKLKLH